MSLPQTEQLSYKQFVYYIYMTQIGVGVLVLPRELTKMSGNSGWISLFISWTIVIAISYILISIMKRFPGKTLFAIFPVLFGKWIGKLFSVVWIAYLISATGVVLFSAIIIVQVWILRNSSQVLLTFALLIPIYLIAKHRIQIQGRYAEFVYIFTIWMPFFLLFSLKEAHFLNLLPVMGDGILPIINGIKVSLLPFLGFEMVFFLYPFLTDKSKAFRGVVVANSFTLVIYLAVTILTTLYFSEKERISYLWPTLQLLKSVTFPFVERFEIVFLAFYLLFISQTLIGYLYFSTSGIAHLFGMKNNALPVLVLFIFFALISFVFEPSISDLNGMSKWYNHLAVGMGYISPIVLWCYWSLWQYSKRGRLLCGEN